MYNVGGVGVQLWDLKKQQAVGEPFRPSEIVRNIRCSPDGSRLAVLGEKRSIFLWELTTGQPATPPLQHEHQASSVSFSADNRHLLVPVQNSSLTHLWRLDPTKPARMQLRHDRQVFGAAVGPDGRLVCTTTNDQRLHFWDTKTGKQLTLLERTPKAVYQAAYSPDGRSVALASGFNQVWLVKPPAPVAGTPEEIMRRLQVLTGTEMTAEGKVRVLSSAEWRERLSSTK
jgi:WD40 repeat protein